jgi:peptidoglycan/xylan/chitin deacetylase (PgdA/CDA1 family)
MTARSHGTLRKLRAAAAPFAKTALLSMGGYAALRRVLPSQHVAILRYHAICGPEGYSYADPSICIAPENFERHVAYLTRNYSVVRLEDAVRALTEHQPLPANAVAITFDDGYADNLAAANTLAKYGATATFYLTAGCLAGGQAFWPAELRHLLAVIKEPLVTLHAGGVHLQLDLTNPAKRAAEVDRVTRAVKSQTIAVREQLRRQLRAAANDTVTPLVMLNWNEVREMHALGMTIGSHTMTHPNLPSAGLKAARDEIIASRARLENEIGAPVTMFSYPNGGAERYVTPELQALVRDAGYAAAATSRNAFAGRHSDVYALERIEVQESLQDLVFALEVERFAFKPRPRQNVTLMAGEMNQIEEVDL